MTARRSDHLLPIWQSYRRPEHATGGRAINQEVFDLPGPGGSGRGQPHGQGAVRLPAQPHPREFDHRRAHPSVAVFSDPLFTFAAAAGKWRSAKPDISAESASIAKLPHECLTHEKCGEVRTDRPQVRQRADHPFRFIRRRVLLENGVTRRLHLFNQLQNELEVDRADVRYALSPFEEWDRRPVAARQSIARGDLVAKPCIP